MHTIETVFVLAARIEWPLKYYVTLFPGNLLTPTHPLVTLITVARAPS